MERRLKERLVGATVLVVTMIVVVPLFLDGPAHNSGADPGTVSELMDLQAAEKRPIVIQLDAPSPTVPTRRASPAAADSPRQETAAEQAGKPPPKTAAAATTSSSSKPPPAIRPAAKPPATPAVVVDTDSGWAVQVGAFSSEKKARVLAEDLRGRKYSAFHVRKNIDGKIVYRVRIGPERDRERAEALASRLKADGLPTTIVRHP